MKKSAGRCTRRRRPRRTRTPRRRPKPMSPQRSRRSSRCWAQTPAARRARARGTRESTASPAQEDKQGGAAAVVRQAESRPIPARDQPGPDSVSHARNLAAARLSARGRGATRRKTPTDWRDVLIDVR
eukprot:365995-Chlamydomonas_euryale.AAC.7